MMNQELCKVGSERHFPSDLWPEILCKLPVKSLLRFRSVSTSWLALIDDAQFARLHRNSFRNNSDETHLLVVHDSSRNCVVRCSDTFETDSGTIHTLGEYSLPGGNWEIVSSVDGLILLSYASDLKVWNASIRKFLELPSLPNFEKSPDSSFLHYDIGLGYDTAAKCYKLVKLVYAICNIFCYPTLHAVAVYTLGANSWKVTEFETTGTSCHGDWFFGLQYYLDRLYFQGCLYFLSNETELVFFDLSREVFSSIKMPEVCQPCYCFYRKCENLALVDGGCSLAAFYDCKEENSIWVLETESMKWTKRYTFQLTCSQFLYLKNNGYILVQRDHNENNAIENAEKENQVRWDQVVSFNPETDEYKIVQEKRASFYPISPICGYVESLILYK